uniref:Uncharacterized protein n=1 Tax=Glossina pallidipes TaxID=7398 RepID=A0A1B0A0U6_GLOPL
MRKVAITSSSTSSSIISSSSSSVSVAFPMFTRGHLYMNCGTLKDFPNHITKNDKHAKSAISKPQWICAYNHIVSMLKLQLCPMISYYTSSPSLDIFAGGGAAKSAIDENSIRFLVPAPPKLAPIPLKAANEPGGANSPYKRLKSTGGVLEGRRWEELLLPSEGAGDGVLDGTLEIAKSTALKLYLPPPGVEEPPLPLLVGVRRSKAGDADDSRLRDDDVDLGGFIIMADKDSCWILSNADGDMKRLLAANVDLDKGSAAESVRGEGAPVELGPEPPPDLLEEDVADEGGAPDGVAKRAFKSAAALF